jgi:flagellin
MSVINTNISATIATNAMARNERQMSTAMERLSTGLRINSAKDDAAGLAISSRMKAVVSGLTMASKNANDALSMLEVAEGATLEISNMLIRMRELAVQSASGTYSDSDRDALDLEFGALMTEMDRIAKNTTWNTMSILNGGNDAPNATATKSVLDIQLGANASQKMELSLKAWVPSVAVDMQALNADGYDNAGGKSVAGAAKADGLDPQSATSSATESRTVTFKDLEANDTITIAGVTLTAGGAMSAELVAAAFANPSATVPAGGSFDKTEYSGWTAEAVTGDTDAVKFTSTTPDKNVDDLTVASVDATSLNDNSAIDPTLGTTAAGAAGTSPVANESAYGDAVLYWNKNGTPTAINIDTVANSEFAIDQLDKAILGVATERAKYGAFMSRLEHSSDNLLNVAQNTDQSRSRIEDADYAVETSELARTQIISQASTAMLAQANQSKQSVLALLQG